ncbi:MAG TPA: glycoside hydrolase family 27 protein [Terriglobia bacterium]|nr:glycoside hydrolase family 27 protein [Terriglobia bacterium]
MRRRSFLFARTFVAFFFLAAMAGAQNQAPKSRAALDGLAHTPPMGWYPWNEFGQDPQNEKLIKEIVEALIGSGMKDAGYVYVGPDEGICFSRGADGKLTTNLERYPSGLRGLGDYIHQRGLKYALYTDAGSRTCSKAMPGTEGHEFDDMAAFAAWRADYVKVDWCNTQGWAQHNPAAGEAASDPRDVAAAYSKLRDAQLAAGRPIVFSLCSWGMGEPWKWAASVGHLWRTTGDICSPGKADWDTAVKNTAANQKLYAAAGPGHWNDPDMLINGMAGLSEAQNRSFFSLWCMMAAPLMAGNDLRRMTPSTIQILTNREAIGIDQDPLGIQGHMVRHEGELEIWADKRLFDGSQAVLIFNPGTATASAHIGWGDFGSTDSTPLYVRDLWTHQTTGPHQGGISVTVPPNDVAFLHVSRTANFPLPPVIVADSYWLSFHSPGEGQQKLTGTITVKTTGSHELPLWKVQSGLPSWLSVTVKKNRKSQMFTCTVSAAVLHKGLYHALVRADNVEPVSGLPMSALYFDVDLEVGNPGQTIQAGK